MGNLSSSVLVAPKRNSYFYGKLMDVDQFTKEQKYLNSKRWLLNRLVLGSGVVCGLDVVTSESPEEGIVVVTSGVAIDGLGREIIVPQSVSVSVRQLTDEHGNPSGDPITTGTVTLCLAFVECEIDPVPVLAVSCDTPNRCAASTIREEFRVLVRSVEAPPSPPPTCTLGVPPSTAVGLHALLNSYISATCPTIVGDPCIPLARIDVATGQIDAVERRLVYGNRLLLELFMCLSRPGAEPAPARILRYVSGDGQQAQAGQGLSQSLVVEVVDGNGIPVRDVLVQFRAIAGAGRLDPGTRSTDIDGRAQAEWMLGSETGEQRAAASAVGAAFSVGFRATATAP
jgi:hypothetical protein